MTVGPAASVEIISIHALRVEGDVAAFLLSGGSRYFYPRPPCGGRQAGLHRDRGRPDISIHALRVEGDQPRAQHQAGIREHISIHALRVEGDGSTTGPAAWICPISIHALRVEGDGRFYTHASDKLQFLSTPSVWRATLARVFCRTHRRISIHALRVEGDRLQSARYPPPPHFYPRPPCGGRRQCLLHTLYPCSISIHALRVEGDSSASALMFFLGIFLSTPSVWRATVAPGAMWSSSRVISIHALRVEGDFPPTQTSQYFPISIHALRVEGDLYEVSVVTFPAYISIHALRVEGDRNSSMVPPKHPQISIHALRVEGDGRIGRNTTFFKTFLSTPSVWRATIHALPEICALPFLSTPSVWRAT